MLPLFKKSHIHSRHIEDLLKTGNIGDYATENNKRNALRQASFLYRIVDDELFRYGTEREYKKYGLRLVVHDDQPEKKAEIIAKCHVDSTGSHLGMNNTIRNISDTYYWQGISAHVKMYLKQCEQCKARSKFNAEEWLELERKNIDKKKALSHIDNEAQKEIKNLGRVKKPTPPETFFIVNAERKVGFGSAEQDGCMMIDSNNIEYVVETLGQSDGMDLEEVCHVLNVPDIVPIPERFRSREIENFLKDGSYPDDFTANMKCGLRGPAVQYKLVNDELYYDGNKGGNRGLRQVIHDDLPALKVKVMVECHIDEDGSHYGLNKTLYRIGEKYHWVGMSVDVRKFMMHCKICSEQRGRKMMLDDREYDQEAQEVKSRHMKKMNETETSGSEVDLASMPVSYDSADIEPTEGLEQEGHQVIRLIGPNKEVTEITVAVVNQETVTADTMEPRKIASVSENDDSFQIVAGESGKGQALVTKEMTDAVAQIEAAEAAMEMAALSEQQDEEMEQESEREEIDKDDQTEEILIMKSEVEEDLELENVEYPQGESDTAEKMEGSAAVGPEGEMAQMETEDGIVNVFIIKEGEKSHRETVQNAEPVSSDGMVVLASGQEQSLEEVASQNDSFLIKFTYFKNVIFVPEIKKTRIIENFLKQGEMAEGFTRSQLMEMSDNFEIIDDVLYRRPSRYKGRQVVVHDDIPELKLKLITDMHLKRSGQHCTELVTYQNVSFKYFWEEMKWDIHRWYMTCKTCVSDSGIERKSNKRILSVEEEKRQLEMKKKGNKRSSLNSQKVRDIRSKFANHFVFMEKYGKGQFSPVPASRIKKMDGSGSSICFKVEGNDGTNEESDVEIHIPERQEEPQIVKVSKKRYPALVYDLAVYATKEQERCIREMYMKKHWTYEPLSFTKASSDELSCDDDDYYLLTMKVTAFQENAIKELFLEMGLAIEASEPKSSNTQEQEIQMREPDSSNQEPVSRHDDQVSTSEKVVRTRESFAQTHEPLVEEEEDSSHGDGMEEQIIHISVPEVHKHFKESQTEKQKVEQVVKSHIKVVSEVKTTSARPEIKRTTVTAVPVVSSVIKKTVEKTQSPAAAVIQAATPKRKFESIQSAETPASETRRSRREIKRPRRFSPDSSPKRLVTIKTEPESPEVASLSQDEEPVPVRLERVQRPSTSKSGVDSPSAVRRVMVTSPKKTDPDIPSMVTVRSTRSTPISSQTDTARNLRSQSETENTVNKEMVQSTVKSEKADEKQKARVSILSKGRIRVKKIVKETKSQSQTKEVTTDSQRDERDIEMIEKSSDSEEAKNKKEAKKI